MGKPEFSSSEQYLPPKTLAERLKAQAQANGHVEIVEIEAASFMAERFAPDLQTQAANDEQAPSEPMAEPAPAAETPPQRSSWSSGVIVMAFALVALVPVIAFGALYSRGALSVASLPAVIGEDRAEQAPQTVQSAAQMVQPAPPVAEPAPAPVQRPPQTVQQAGAAMPAASETPPSSETILAKRDIELPPVTLTTPASVVGEAGKETAFHISLDSSENLPARSIITVRGLPEGTSFSAGRPFGETEWSLRPDEINGLRLKLPAAASGRRALSVNVVAADGTMIASSSTRLDIAPDPKAALILRPQDTARIDELIAHGRKMVDVGYFPGARAYFQRAAEAGSAEAAFSVGLSYDPSFIADMGAQGIKPDVKQARIWYERAKALGYKDADAKLNALSKSETAVEATPAPASSKPAEVPVVPVVTTPQPVVEPATPQPSETGAANPEWVEVSSPVNVRSAPTPEADTINVAEPGKRYQATGRQGSWVQVTDPTTSESGWVYARYVAASEAPNR
ncbi:MAG TPA: SH3 domain-containing protein [Methyloceanibacter sp.]|nr:SH3 domain-containing protein [Methyloceanibacter sp.]